MVWFIRYIYVDVPHLIIALAIYLFIVNCSDPSPVAGVIFSPFSDTTEGANISYNCGSGLEPQREDVSVCSSNGLWVPDPEDRICYASEFNNPITSNASLVPSPFYSWLFH